MNCSDSLNRAACVASKEAALHRLGTIGRNIVLAGAAITSVMAASAARGQFAAVGTAPPLGCSSTFPSSGSNVFTGNQAAVISGVVGTTNAITSVIGTVDTAFLGQGSAYIASSAAQQADLTGGGFWGRAISGRVDNQSTGTFNGITTASPAAQAHYGIGPGASGTIGCGSDIRQDYGGFQFGQDLARLNLGGSGSDVHLGVTAGYAEVNAQDKLGSSFSGNFQVPFAGLYGRYANGSFYADTLARWDFYQMTLRAPEAALAGQNLDARGFSISATAGYFVSLGNNWFVEPSASVIHSTVNVDTLNSVGGLSEGQSFFGLGAYSLQFGTIESTLGRVGARVGTSFTMGNLVWQPFATASVWHEFEGNTTTNYQVSPDGFVAQQGVSSFGTLSGSRVGTYGQYSLGISGELPDTPWLGYLRIDYKNGSNIEGWGLSPDYAPAVNFE